jgi:hypothetical protein
MVADSVPAESGKTQIFRVARNSENPFANIPRAMINDARLSWAARGLLAYIFSKPDDWEVRSYDLMRQGGIGRDALRSILQELVLYGYLHREKRRHGDGRFIWESVVYEIPFVGEQETDRSRPHERPCCLPFSNAAISIKSASRVTLTGVSIRFKWAIRLTLNASTSLIATTNAWLMRLRRN